MVDGMTCWEQLGSMIAWEYQDAELLAEHFLTVASYNLQHPAQFTDEAIAGLQSSFLERLQHGLPISAIRRRAGAAYAGSKRVKRDIADRHPVFHPWSMTIADVYLPNHPQNAAQRVRTWAATIQHELEAS